MAINVNRLVVGFNCNLYNTAYFTRVAKSCPVIPTAPQVDGSFLICKAGGLAWFVAPASTQIDSEWANGTYNNITANPGTRCCISEWGVLGSCLNARGYVSTEWFVPTQDQLVNPGWICRTNWGQNSVSVGFWASNQSDSANANRLYFVPDNVSCRKCVQNKATIDGVRAFRCVTY